MYNYIWVIDNFIAYYGAYYIIALTVVYPQASHVIFIDVGCLG